MDIAVGWREWPGPSRRTQRGPHAHRLHHHHTDRDLRSHVEAAMSTIATIATAVSPLLTLSVGLFMRHKIQEVHVMVNDRMSATVQLLTDALQDNVRLKDQAGEPPGPPAVAPPASPAAAAATTVVVAAAAAAAEVAKEEEAGKLQ